MSDSERPSRRPTELSVLGQVRDYRDDAVLERAWSRLESRRRRPAGMAPGAQWMAAAALVGMGVFVGMMVERFSNQSGVASNSSELVATAEVPAGPVMESTAPRRAPSRARRPRRSNQGPRNAVPRRARRSASLTAEIDEMVDEDFVDEQMMDALAEEPAPPPPKPEWLLLADRGDFAGAFQVLDQSDGFSTVVANGTPEELMTLVDIARSVGQQGRAVQVLRVVTEKYQGDPNAPLAAMMLGNLLSRAGDAEGAAHAFALNRRLSPGGDFAEDALVREFDMAMAASDLETVKSLLSQYEQEFPQGRHLEELRTEAARLVGSVGTLPTSADKAGGESPDSAETESDSSEESDSTSGQSEQPVDGSSPDASPTE